MALGFGTIKSITKSKSRVGGKDLVSPVQALCTNCGLCCNGILFADVELTNADSAAKLKRLGLELFRKGRRLAFDQPCRCFDGTHCTIYENRPAQCHAFECALLQSVTAKKSTVASALKTIARAKRMVKRVESMLSRSNEDDPSLPLIHRYGKVVAAPMELSRRTGQDRLKGLMPAMADLMELLQARFLRK